MNKKDPEPEEKALQEFNRRIKNYDTLNFLEDSSALLSVLTMLNKKPTDQETIAKVTSQQLRALPIQR